MTKFTPADQEIRKEIEQNLDQTLAVSAGAGTGKTTLLTRRYISLLKNKDVSPSEIVAITFTKKAATELRDRIRTEMIRQDLSEMLLQFQSAPIGTIHSFCASVLKQFAIEAGLDPHFEQMDTIEQYEFLGSSFRSWFSKKVADTKAYQDFISTGYGFAKVQQLAIELYHFRDLVDCIEFDFQPVTKDRINHFVRNLESIYVFANECCNDMTDEGYLAIHHLHQSVKHILDLSVEDACKILLRENGISKKGRQTSWKTKDQGKDFKARVDAVRSELENIQKDFSVFLLSNLVLWLKGYLQFVEMEKRDQSVLDFDDLLFLTRDLLRNKPDVLEILKRQYHYFLIDEFQDTDPIQAEIFWRLSQTPLADHHHDFSYDSELTNGKLFTVGDLNQSIYRFRNASVETYERCIQSLQIRGKLLHITQNFRSNPNILTTLNLYFSDFLANPFLPLSTLPEESWNQPAIHVLQQLEEDARKQDIRNHEALSIANHIQQLIHSGYPIFDYNEQRTRNIEYSDVAILFPVSTDLDLYEFALKKSSIPFSLYRSGSFFQTLEVRSIMQIITAILHPYDNLKVVEALSSMFMGFSYDDLALMKKTFNTFDYRNANIAKIPEHLRTQIEILQTFGRNYPSLTPSQFVEQIIEAAHALPHIQFRFNVEQAEQNVYKCIWLAREFETRHTGNIFDFETWLRELSQHSDEVSEARVPGEPNSVQIMTIHQAKGLEFPIVFVANLSSEIRTSRTLVANRFAKTLDFRMGDKDSPLRTKNYDQAFESENQFLNDEKKRLLYVGLTRAKNILVIPSPSEKDKKTYMELLAPIFDHDSGFEKFNYKNKPSSSGNNQAVKKHSSPSEIDLSFLSKISKGYERVTATEQKETVVSSQPNTYSFLHRPKLGIAFHAYMERHGINENTINQSLVHQMATEYMLEDRGNELKELIQIFLQSDLFARIQKAKSVFREIPFSFFDNQILFEGYIDMMIEESDGLTIIDFKTDKVSLKDLPDRSKIYEPQLEIYAKALKNSAGLPVKEKILYFVRLNKSLSSSF